MVEVETIKTNSGKYIAVKVPSYMRAYLSNMAENAISKQEDLRKWLEEMKENCPDKLEEYTKSLEICDGFLSFYKEVEELLNNAAK